MAGQTLTKGAAGLRHVGPYVIRHWRWNEWSVIRNYGADAEVTVHTAERLRDAVNWCHDAEYAERNVR